MEYGRSALSHPLMVEAIETCFVPVLIHNNTDGVDAVVLKRFEEPAWNNPVTRFITAEGVDIIPRRDRIWTTPALAQRIVAALKARSDDGVPGWFLGLAQDFEAESGSGKNAEVDPGTLPTPWCWVPMTLGQRQRLSAALAKGGEGPGIGAILSPRQQEWGRRLDEAVAAGRIPASQLAAIIDGGDLVAAWDRIGTLLKPSGPK